MDSEINNYDVSKFKTLKFKNGGIYFGQVAYVFEKNIYKTKEEVLFYFKRPQIMKKNLYKWFAMVLE